MGGTGRKQKTTSFFRPTGGKKCWQAQSQRPESDHTRSGPHWTSSRVGESLLQTSSKPGAAIVGKDSVVALRLSIIANPRKSFTGLELLFGADSQIRTDDLLITNRTLPLGRAISPRQMTAP